MNTALTDIELSVLTYLAEGATFPGLARRLEIGESTARKRAQRAYRKLGARSAANAVAIALRSGVLPGLTDGPAHREDEPTDPPAHPDDPFRYPLGAGLPRKEYPYRTTEAQEAKS